MRLISLGAGVQSTCLLLMAVRGELAEAVDGAIFADTGWEPRAVYRHLEWLQHESEAAGIPVHRVSAGNIRADALDTEHNFVSMPLFVAHQDGSLGMLTRQCTREYKLAPIYKFLRARGATHKNPVDLLLGISLDEAIRMRTARHKFLRHLYPLIDLRMTRHDCMLWMEHHGYARPPKSACIGCPFRSDAQWRDLRDNYPDEWADAVAFDAAVRQGMGQLDRPGFLHKSGVPLPLVDLSTPQDHGQMDMFGNECEGMCGV